jgi:hypothetical protein
MTSTWLQLARWGMAVGLMQGCVSAMDEVDGDLGSAEDTDDADAAVAGAATVFTTYEAEAAANATSGTRIALTTLPDRLATSPELEASGRAYVRLDAANEFLEIPVTRRANRLVLRHSIPDAAAGGGQTATLDLFVNGTFRQRLTLSSKFNWLYGAAGENGQSNLPSAGTPHVFWDDAGFALTGPALEVGDKLRLTKTASNTAAFYDVDLVDLELAGAALPAPVGAASCSAAIPDDNIDDAAAIQRCIDDAAAATPKRIVYLPAGAFHVGTKLDVKGVAVRGAGYWYTRVVVAPKVRAFRLNNSGAKVQELAIVNEATTTRSEGTYAIEAVFGVATNWTVENVWIQHTSAGLWMSNARNGVVRGVRIYNTYADGINLNRGSSNNLVENCYVRGGGDDGIALISEEAHGDVANPMGVNNTARNNTLVAMWWGVNLSLRGGSGHVVEDNILADSTQNPCLAVNLEPAFPMYPITSATFRRNSLARCGGNKAGQKRGAIFLSAADAAITGVTFTDTIITSPIFRGVHFHTGSQTLGATFTKTTITSPGEDAVFVPAGASPVGTSAFTTGSITGLRAGFVKFKFTAASTPNFQLTTSGI